MNKSPFQFCSIFFQLSLLSLFNILEMLLLSRDYIVLPGSFCAEHFDNDNPHSQLKKTTGFLVLLSNSGNNNCLLSLYLGGGGWSTQWFLTFNPLIPPALQTKADHADNAEVEITRCSRGQYFGELALVTNKPRAASAYAVGDVKCLGKMKCTPTHSFNAFISINANVGNRSWMFIQSSFISTL